MVAVLFARRDSVYKSLGVDVFDADRDARTFNGTCPVIAHPPCRMWGRYHHKAKGSSDEAELARFAVRTLRRNGGILEHPHGSKLWPDMCLPLPDALLAVVFLLILWVTGSKFPLKSKFGYSTPINPVDFSLDPNPRNNWFFFTSSPELVLFSY